MKLTNIIFCDDIRYEQHNKISLMGIYGDKIQFTINDKEKEITWPIPIRLSLLLRFQRDIKSVAPNRFEFDYILNEKVMISVQGAVTVDETQSLVNITINAGGLPVELGSLGFNVKIYRDDKLLHEEETKSAIKITKT